MFHVNYQNVFEMSYFVMNVLLRIKLAHMQKHGLIKLKII